VDNPIVLGDHYAVVQLKNTTHAPITLYTLHPPWMKDDVLRLENGIRVQTEVVTPQGTVLEVLDGLRSTIEGPQLYSQRMKQDYATISIEPNAEVMLRLHFLGDFPRLFNHAAGLPESETVKKIPGEYSIRVRLTYVDATTDETKQIYSDTVQITVTPEHIAEAEKFINMRLP